MQLILGRRQNPQAAKKAKRPPSLIRWWLACGGSLVFYTVWLARNTYVDPSAPWRGFQWLVTLGLLAAGGWILRAKQRKQLWGDKAFQFWLWHWFTGAPLVVVNDRRLPWWQDVRNCWPFLDTTKSEACPEHRRWQCIAQRTLVGAGRTLGVAALIAAEYKRSGAPHGTGPLEFAKWGLGGTLALAAAILLVVRGAIGAARWSWWYHPLHMALYDRIGWPADKRPRRWVIIPRTFFGGTKPIKLRMPLDVLLSQDNKTKTQEQLLGVLGLDAREVDFRWDPEGKRSWLYLLPVKRVPETVLLSSERVQRALDQTKGRWAYLVGFTNGWRRVVQSIESQAPHILIAGPSKTGKSQLLKIILWQLLRKTRKLGRAHVVFLDIKGYSHDDDFEHRPGVTYCRQVDTIAAALVDVMGKATVRAAEFTAAKAAGKRLTFAPIFVVLEDAGAVVPKLPREALQAWDDILSLGRGVAIHAIALPHRPDQKYLGSGAIRDNLGNRILMSGHGSGAKKMAAEDAEYDIPPEKRGRFVVLEGLHGIHTQGILDDKGIVAADLDELLGPRALPAEHQSVHEPNAPVHSNGQRNQQAQQHDAPDRHSNDQHGNGSGAHAHILTGVRDDGKSQSNDPREAAEETQGEGKPVPVGAAPSAEVVRRILDRLAGRAPSPEGPGVMGPDTAAATTTVPPAAGARATVPAPTSNPTTSAAPQPHSPSPSRFYVPGDGSEGGAGGRQGDTGGRDTGPVTLREAYDGKLVGDGVEYETVRSARRRTHRVIRERFAGDRDAAAHKGWWFPDPCGVRRVLPNGEKEHEYDPPELDRWWRSRPRGEPDDGLWWVYFMVQGGLGNTRWGSVVKIGYTTDLEDRCRKFGNHYPGDEALARWIVAGMPAGGPGGDIVYLERFGTKKEAVAAEGKYHRRWKREFRRVDLDDDPPILPHTSLMCWPHGGGGNSGREQFWIEGTLASFMAQVCPRRRRKEAS